MSPYPSKVTMGTVSDTGTVDGSKPYIKTETGYTANGAFVQSETDQRGNTVTYNISPTTGRINVVTDPKNNKTGYVYDDTTHYLNRVNAWSSSDQLVSSVFYEYFGPEYGGILRRIRFSDSYYYNFVYNAWNGLRNVRINNSRELVQHTYNDRNGSLNQSTYGNGQTVEFLYDGYGRLSGKKANGTQTAAFAYDALGRLSRVKDLTNGHTTLYEYDIAGRLTRQLNGQGSFRYQYDNMNRLTRQSVTVDGTAYTTSYEYLDANRPGKTDLRVGKVERTYDSLQRETEHRVYSNDHLNKYLETTTTFIPVSGNRTTQLPKIYTTFREEDGTQTRPGGYTGFTYAYDANGNITSVTETNGTSSRVRSYTYDAMNRLTQDVDPVTGKTTTYTYDTRGNILSKTASGQTVTYTYGDSTWKDLLTSYNGTAITYDTIGNPLSYRGMTFAWQQGRQLASATLANGTAITYRYNTDGIRIGKTVGNVTTEYVVDDSGTIHAMKQGGHTLIFMYDATGRREGFICYSDTYGDAAYYYLYNAQGDVIGLTDGDLNTVVQYAYDAWGNPTALTGTKASTIGTLNPFRYRGYVYDTETELYYLQSRYYDPEVGRFINADGYASTGQGINGSNVFAYCGNNPVRNADISGTRYCEATTVSGESLYGRKISCQHQGMVTLEKQNPDPIGRYDGKYYSGNVYLVEDLDSVKVTFPGDVVALDCRNPQDKNSTPDVQIQNSSWIWDEEAQLSILNVLVQHEREHPSAWERDSQVETILLEWDMHTVLYQVTGVDNFLHADIDNDDASLMSFFYYGGKVLECLF